MALSFVKRTKVTQHQVTVTAGSECHLRRHLVLTSDGRGVAEPESK